MKRLQQKGRFFIGTLNAAYRNMNPDKQRGKIKKALQDAYYALSREDGQKAVKKYEKANRKLYGDNHKEDEN